MDVRDKPTDGGRKRVNKEFLDQEVGFRLVAFSVMTYDPLDKNHVHNSGAQLGNRHLSFPH